LPHGWHVSAGSYAIAPIPPEGLLLDDYIEQRWEGLPPVQPDLPEWAGNAIAPIPPKGPLLDDYIEQRWEALPPVQPDLPEWAPTCAIWLPIL
jgi:uncharacterized protein YbdZ (MbtH family)